LSEGRAIAGLGIGWLKDEYHISNIQKESRGKRAMNTFNCSKRYGLMML
jgi:alkanesulfonate monooxygenase SsuD/methylene tetrahydromethanopterin reductase-like flavin-dependent oxidoreductase (luciferase family)